MQHTINQTIEISGIGLHSGRNVNLNVYPAEIGEGIIFKRVDLAQSKKIPASYEYIVDTRLCTVIGHNEATVGTIEHLMAALRACGVDNAFIEIDGPEVPILDGSSKIFIDEIEKAGLRVQSSPRKAIRILKEISYSEGSKEVRLSPSVIPVYSGEIRYESTPIGTQRFELKFVNGNFKHDVSDCRTFCLLKDVEAMQANGLAQGGSLDNAVVVDDTGVLNEEGLRCHDEFIRHKLLDAVGDLSLSGALILGRYEGICAGHDMNYKLLKTLFENRDSWEYVDLYVNFESSDDSIYEHQDLEQIESVL
ncbi:MAG: UDP-3-O-acyl-N-acetylglucosamine deacetylase [Pseudomonadota bacterium]